jgi:Zn-dependent peptidase ImmA (M78 family)
LVVLIADSLPSKKMIGVSIKDSIGQRIVGIEKAFFDKNKNFKYRIENVVFHELGHALLRRKHNNHYSIMNTSSPVAMYETDTTMRRVLLNELFYGDTVNIFTIN